MNLKIFIEFSLWYSLERYLKLLCCIGNLLGFDSYWLYLTEPHFILHVKMNNCLFPRTLPFDSFGFFFN